MAEQGNKTYRGNCHCGAFIYEASTSEITSFAECNCSICSKIGYAWHFVGEDDLKFVKGDKEDLTKYTFGTRQLIHHFCPTCGTPLYAFSTTYPPQRNTAINVRALQHVDFESLKVTPYDGKSRGTPYQPPTYTGPQPTYHSPASSSSTATQDTTPPSKSKLYHGSCHCGKVQLAFTAKKPLEEYNTHTDEDCVQECNCSVCHRGAYVWTYPAKEQVVLTGQDGLEHYSFGSGMTRKAFCKTCGVHLINEIVYWTDERVAKLPESFKDIYVQMFKTTPINLRVLNDFDWKTLQVSKTDGAGLIKPAYVDP